MSEQDNSKKDEFAVAFFENGGNSFEAARTIFSSTGEALRYANEWALDGYVRQKVKELESNRSNSVPTKTQLVQGLWLKAASAEPDDYVKILKLIADILGYIEINSLKSSAEATSRALTITLNDAAL